MRDAHRSTSSHKRSCHLRGACCAPPPARCAIADAAALRSTIYLLVIGTLAVTGIPSAGPDVHPPMWRRDVWAALWVVRLSRASSACCSARKPALTPATAAMTDRLLPRRAGARWACVCERTCYACASQTAVVPLMLCIVNGLCRRRSRCWRCTSSAPSTGACCSMPRLRALNATQPDALFAQLRRRRGGAALPGRAGHAGRAAAPPLHARHFHHGRGEAPLSCAAGLRRV
jgi:hypothetical protein